MSEYIKQVHELNVPHNSLTIDYDMFAGFEMDSQEMHLISFHDLCRTQPDKAWSIFNSNLRRITEHATELTNSGEALKIKSDSEDRTVAVEAINSLPGLDLYMELPIAIYVHGPENEIEDSMVLYPPSLVA